ncbi:MAG: ribosome maturation factor RimP [Magnetococcales bacterium]|nr:ribosome maturation factor RimP [Magnetococcales bacterium]
MTDSFEDPPIRLTLVEQLERLASEAAVAAGCELVGVELHSETGGRLIRVYLDRVEGGLRIADCEAVSDRLSALMDLHDLMPGRHRLEISSPGLTRPLKKREEFARFKGRLAVIHAISAPSAEGNPVAAPVATDKGSGRKPAAGANRTMVKGMLQGMDEDDVLIDVGDTRRRIPFRLIAKAHLDFDFNRGTPNGNATGGG